MRQPGWIKLITKKQPSSLGKNSLPFSFVFFCIKVFQELREGVPALFSADGDVVRVIWGLGGLAFGWDNFWNRFAKVITSEWRPHPRSDLSLSTGGAWREGKKKTSLNSAPEDSFTYQHGRRADQKPRWTKTPTDQIKVKVQAGLPDPVHGRVLVEIQRAGSLHRKASVQLTHDTEESHKQQYQKWTVWDRFGIFFCLFASRQNSCEPWNQLWNTTLKPNPCVKPCFEIISRVWNPNPSVKPYFKTPT